MANLWYRHHFPFWVVWTEDTLLKEMGQLAFLQLMAKEVEEAHKIAEQPRPPKEPTWKAWLRKQEELMPMCLAKETPEAKQIQLQ